MKGALILAPFALALAACADASEAVADVTAQAEAAAYKPLAAPAQVFPSPLAVVDHFARFAPETMEGAPELTLRAIPSAQPDTLELHFTSEGYLDDSVSGERWRVLIRRAGDGWAVVEAGWQVKCGRGPQADVWSMEACP